VVKKPFQPIPVPCEAARYGAPVLYLPDLWLDAAIWRPWSTFLGHRGWEGWLVPLRGVEGGILSRVSAVTDFARTLAGPPVLLGEGAGAVVAALVAGQIPVTAVILLAPLVPGESRLSPLLLRRDAWWPLLAGGRVPPPPPGMVAPFLGGGGPTPPPSLLQGLGPEPAPVLLDLARGRVTVEPVFARSLVVAASGDVFTPPSVAQRWAEGLGAEFECLPDLPRRFSAHASWQAIAGGVHRWLVRGLDTTMLEFYAEAMADRGDAED
jgi:hypothetical protein